MLVPKYIGKIIASYIYIYIYICKLEQKVTVKTQPSKTTRISRVLFSSASKKLFLNSLCAYPYRHLIARELAQHQTNLHVMHHTTKHVITHSSGTIHGNPTVFVVPFQSGFNKPVSNHIPPAAGTISYYTL